MAFNLRFLFRHAARFVWYGSIGVLLTLVVVFVLLMNNRPDLSIWHLAELDEEFTVDSQVSSFGATGPDRKGYPCYIGLSVLSGLPQPY